MSGAKILKQTIKDYFELTKPRIIFLVWVTTAMGFVLAKGGDQTFLNLFYCLLGTSIASAGAAALNHCIERDSDRLMQRTQNRPVASGRIPHLHGMAFGIVLVLIGVFFLKEKVNLLSAFLVLLTAFLYVLVYTPLKKLTWWNTFFGSIPGAMPPLVGWAATRGELDPGAYILFLILFAWQHPHFYSLAWIFKDDYARGGYKMLPVIDESGRRTVTQSLFYSLVLLVVSVLPVFFDMAGELYLTGAVIIGSYLLVTCLDFLSQKSLLSAKRLFRASLVYFPVLLLLILVDMAVFG